MRMVGYCISCHKIKQVHVSMPSFGATPAGTCFDCEEIARWRRSNPTCGGAPSIQDCIRAGYCRREYACND